MEAQRGSVSPAILPREGGLASESAPTKLVAKLPQMRQSLGALGQGLLPLTVIRAPMGWGKTAMLESWVDELPSEVPRFVVDVEAVDWLHDLRSWSGTLSKPGVAVIDDYERATSAANDSALLRTLVANPNLHLVVAGRRFSVLDTPVVTLRVDTTLIARADLALGDQEVAQIARDAGHGSSKHLEEMLPKAAGWRLAVEEMVGRYQGQPQEAAGVWGRLGDCELLNDPAKEKVLRLILLTRGTSARTLNAASGLDESTLDRAMTSLLESGLVEERWDGPRMHYVPHDLIEGLPSLMSEGRSLDGDEERVLLLEAEDLARIDPLQALNLLVDRGLDEAAGLLGQRYFLQLSSRPAEVEEIFAEVGEEGITKNRALASLRIFLGFTDTETPASTLFAWGQHLRSFVPSDPPQGTAPTIGDLALTLVADLVEGSWQSVPKAAQRLEKALAERSHIASHGDWTNAPLLYSLVAAAGLLGRELALAERAAIQSRNAARVENNPGAEAEAHHTLAMIMSMQGRVSEARHYLDGAARLLEDHDVWVKAESKANAAVAEATVLLGDGDLTKAKAKLAKVKPIVGRTTALEAFIMVGTWIVRLTEGNKGALEWLRHQVSRISTSWANPAIQSNLVAAVADLLIYEGELRTAEQLLSTSTEATDQTTLAAARLAFARGEVSRVPPLLLELDRPDTDPVAAATAMLLDAAVQIETGNASGALSTLEKLDALPRDSLVTLLLSTIPYGPLRRLGKAAREAGNERLSRLVEALPQEHRFQTLEPLSPTEQEVLEQLAEKKSIREVASLRGVSANTIKVQTRRIYRKLQVSNRKDMARVARDLGLI